MTFPNHAFFFFIFKVSVCVFYIKRFCPHKLSKVSLDNTKSSNYILLRQLSREHRSSNIMATAQYRCSPALRLGFNLESLLFHRHHRVFDPPKTSAALKLLITLCCFFFFPCLYHSYKMESDSIFTFQKHTAPSILDVFAVFML